MTATPRLRGSRRRSKPASSSTVGGGSRSGALANGTIVARLLRQCFAAAALEWFGAAFAAWGVVVLPKPARLRRTQVG